MSPALAPPLEVAPPTALAPESGTAASPSDVQPNDYDVVAEAEHIIQGVAPSSEAAMPDAAEKSSRWQRLAKRLGKQAVKRIAIEGTGLVVDSALIGAGSIVTAMQDPAIREIAASGVDSALNNLAPEAHAQKPSRTRRIGHLAATVSGAIIAQKYGPGIIGHVAHVNHGAGYMASALASKLSATAGINAAFKRF